MLYDLYDLHNDDNTKSIIPRILGQFDTAKNRESFGKSNHGDNNKEDVLSIKQILFEIPMNAESVGLSGYMLAAENLFPDKARQICLIFIYNYGGSSSSKCDTYEDRVSICLL
ncbi:hypothetical protein DLAC_07937 [Tieghemostelium lacteum]|uniref:Uncharacterized protein n=1 Tax=Tieghemostelium lacteum TaxID=361077 RepID=A0A151ZAT0_TIELA|nr:hypothetical protein DLAC_07937 [Tieghemostelium lacteum]|eukprot:KYQ91036.1 hypothetical protein DLAC_07937 [Tieghemostelium lacteum]